MRILLSSRLGERLVIWTRAARLLPVRAVGVTVAVLSALLVAPTALGAGTPACVLARFDDKCEMWVARYDNGSADIPTSVAASPDGTKVFATGYSLPPGETRDDRWDAATVAYDATTGLPVWTARFAGPEGEADAGVALAPGSGGDRVYVTGIQDAPSGISLFGGPSNAMLIAYDARTGEELWRVRHDSGSTPFDAEMGLSIAVDDRPAGDRIYMAGMAAGGAESSADFLVQAYDEGGREFWSSTLGNVPSGWDEPSEVRISPDGTSVFVSGRSQAANGHYDFLTVAYDSGLTDDEHRQSGGTVLWESRYNGPAERTDIARALELSPDGTRVFVAGSSQTQDGDTRATTLAYDASDGALLWTHTYDGPIHFGSDDLAEDLAVSPHGDRIFVAGVTIGANGAFLTIALDASSGEAVWTACYEGPNPLGNERARGIGISPDGNRVFVTGESMTPIVFGFPITYVQGDWATVAYEASSGSQLWAARHNSSDDELLGTWAQPNFNTWSPIAISPKGGQVFVARAFSSFAGALLETESHDYGIVAYEM